LTLEESSPKTETFAFWQKKASSMKQTDSGTRLKKASKSVCKLTVLVFPDPLSHIPSTSAMMTPESTEEDLDNHNQQMKGISEYSTPLISCTVEV
jgi:hypothetical protein